MESNSSPSTWQGGSSLASGYLWYLRRLPDHPAKLRIARYVAAKLFPEGLPLIGPQNARLSLDLSRADYISHQIAYTGFWEPKSVSLAVRLMSAGGVFLDIGSHFGLYSCVIGSLDNVECVCVEPSPEAFMKLQDNIRRNPSVRARLVHTALSSEDGIKRFGTVTSTNTGTARIWADNSANGSTYMVACTTLNRLCETLGASLSIRLLKIDVEGHEMNVLAGLDWSSPYRPENIIAEFETAFFSQASEEFGQMIQFFQDRDYDALTVEGQIVEGPDNLPENNIWFKSRS